MESFEPHKHTPLYITYKYLAYAFRILMHNTSLFNFFKK